MDAFATCVIYWTVRNLVDRGHTRIFNNVQIVGREPNQYPHFLHRIGLSEENALKVYDPHFQNTRIFGNLIHLTHGSVPDNKLGSVPIIATAIRDDDAKMRDVRDFVPLPLYFNKKRVGRLSGFPLSKDPREDQSESIKGIMKATAEAVLALEKKMLADVDKQEDLRQ
jgi:hypothetical protein